MPRPRSVRRCLPTAGVRRAAICFAFRCRKRRPLITNHSAAWGGDEIMGGRTLRGEQGAAMSAGAIMKNIGILLSGRGSNFEAIAQNVAAGKISGARIAVVISNKADAGGLETARRL